jgi:hypothetical protein
VPSVITIDNIRQNATLSTTFVVRGTFDAAYGIPPIACTLTRPGAQPIAAPVVVKGNTYWAYFDGVPANNQYQVESDLRQGGQTVAGSIVGNLTVANNDPDITTNAPNTGDQVAAAGFQASGTYLISADPNPSGLFTLYDGTGVLLQQVSGPLANNAWSVTFTAIPPGMNYQVLAELISAGFSVAADLVTNLTAQ